MTRTQTAKYNEDVSLLINRYLDGYINKKQFIVSMRKLLESAWYDDDISPYEYRLITKRLYPLSLIYLLGDIKLHLRGFKLHLRDFKHD